MLIRRKSGRKWREIPKVGESGEKINLQKPKQKIWKSRNIHYFRPGYA